MRSTVQALADYVSEYSSVLLPAAVFVTTAASEVSTPIPHSLLTSSLSWGLIWGCSVLRVGFAAGLQNVPRKRLSWAAGALFALAQICSRASLDKEAVWWMKALLPACVYIILESNLILKGDGSPSPEGSSNTEPTPVHGSARLLAIVTISAGFAMSASYITSQTTALSFNSVVFLACALIALESAIVRTKDEKYAVTRGFVSANGSFSRRGSSSSGNQENPGTCLRDAAAVAALACGAGALVLESFRADTLSYDLQIDKLGGDWRFVQNLWLKIQFLLAVGLGAVQNAFIFAVVDQRHALFTSIILLSACLFVRIVASPSLWNAWFTVLSGLSLVAFADDQGSPSQQTQSRVRRRLKHLILLLSFVSVVPIAAYAFRRPVAFQYLNREPHAPLIVQPPAQPFGPVRVDSTKSHPIQQLMKNGESEFAGLLERQSKSLHDAVAEYRRRYKLHPPPHFDLWYEFAKRKGVQLIDEFDTIHDLMLPFWGLEPATIRARAREAIGNKDNMMVAVLIRDGQVVKIERGEEWQQKATTGMVQEFVQYLPDMDLAFNIHDEPRVIVPHDRLTWLMDIATNQRVPKASANNSPKNAFSSRPKDMNDGKTLEETNLSRFNVFAHQPTWTHSRVSCAPNSPARAYEEVPTDNLTSYALGELGFVYNQSAFMDICMSPSFAATYGFFGRPNAYNLVQELFPVFSQSKIGSYQDFIYPSPWYWAGKVVLDKEKDLDWEQKKNSLYWRGSTTGGYSKKGGWRRQHRQRLVQRLNAPDTATILTNAGSKGSPDWRSKEIKRDELKDLIDVRFSHVGQCDEDDCNAQKEFFQVTERVDPQDAWQWKHLLDIDGNAFSGRFYAFLQSKSLIYKMAVFQEWHKDWLKPWVHYIPLSLRGDEWLEAVRYFSSEEEGQAQAARTAIRSREWANQVLRNEDLEVWFFRVLLEYGRIIDDNRESIGYAGP